ncbi:sugar porter family MFS transporter [Bifidobacterium pullorum subsp. saeculare]|uniref:Sugar porter family MFS transporter n=2 Tax=Bifidobacterium pullorum TaxID=78448 RepID=A0A938WZB2_9BIFI|nr:sugar porter family MFS transporter [Bifidobacterium pullorum subsp. saeculare]
MQFFRKKSDMTASTSAPAAQKQGSMKYVVILALSAGMAGLLYGYDTVSISGAIEFLRQAYDLSSGMQGLVISSIMIGGVIGVGFSGFLADRIGRRKVLLIGAALFFAAALWSAFTYSPGTLIAARIIGGLGIGLASALAITYITECAPAKYRGTLSSAYQLLTILGIFLTNVINFWIAGMGDLNWGINAGWRWMLGIGALPAAIFFIALFLSPESPRFLIQSGKEEAGFKLLEKIGGTEEAHRELEEVKASIERDKNGKLSDLFRKPLLIPFLIGLLLATFNQLGGQNAVSYYGPTMFKAALGNDIPNVEFLCSSLVGLVELLFTFVGMYLIDKAGRKPLLVSSAAGMGVFAAVIAFAFAANIGWLVIAGACGFIAFFAFGLGPVTWVMIPELFPTYMRGRASGLCTVLLWGINFCVGQFTPMMFEGMGGTGTFIFWMVMDFLGAILIFKFAPETKGKTLEEIQALWTKKN